MRSLLVRAAGSDLGRALTLAAISACILLPLLSQPLWRDEGSTFIDVSQPNVAGVLDSVRINELTPPLYFLLEHFWIRFAGTTEFALRFPSLVAIALAIALLYDTARRVRDGIAGYAAAACACLAPVSLFLGSEARAYALTLFLGALVMWLIAQLLFAQSAGAYKIAVVLAVVTACFCWTNYTAWPAVIALLIVTPPIWVSGSSKRALLLLLALASGATTTLPMIPNFVAAAASIHVPLDSHLSNTFQRIETGLFWLNPLVLIGPALPSVLVGGTLVWFIRLRPPSRRLVLTPEDQFLIACLAVMLLGVGASMRPSLQGYHLAAYAPAAWLTTGSFYGRFTAWLGMRAGLRALPLPRKLGFLVLATATILAFASFPVLYSYELGPRSGSLALARELKRDTVGDVVIIAVPDALSPSLYYYLRNDSRITLRGLATWSEPWYYYYTTGWDNPSLKVHFLSLIDSAFARNRRVAFAVAWTAANYNGHRYDLALEAAREENARHGVAFRHTFSGTLETMELTLLAPDQASAQRIPKR